MYCPNCGTKQKTETPGTCAKCEMPLAEASDLVAKHRAAVHQLAAEPGIPRERLIGAAACLAIAAIPLGMGVKNSLQKKP